METEFQNYVQNLNISENFKTIILDSDFINRNPSFYRNYSSLFANIFSIGQKELNLLDIAGFLYYQATIFTDTLIDEKEISNFHIITICQEEGIKILATIYGLESVFWKFWNERRNEYFEAVFLEKKLANKAVVTIEEYEILADKKSAFGKVAIDSLFCIENLGEDLHKQLLVSHKYFSTAFQINDDIHDFKEDLKKGQFNWAVYILKQQNNLSDQKDSDPDILEKHLYIKGVSKQLYELAIEYCNKSLEILMDIDVAGWKKVISDTKKSYIVAIEEIENYLKILTSEVTLSNETYLKNSIGNSISFAIDFIKSRQEKNGCWHEYINQGGISNIWSTAFILSKISEESNIRTVFKNQISKALFFLDQKSDKSSLWGYNSTSIKDADSTNFVFLAYSFNNKKIKTILIKKWMSFQKPNGGFCSYSDSEAHNLKAMLNDKKVLNIKGWLSVHNCVSAASFYFLAKYNQKSNSFLSIKKYFDENFESDINAYWWTSNIYSYYYLVKTYVLINDYQKVNMIINLTRLKQNINGSFSDKYGENMFYTALGLEILALQDNNKIIRSEIKKGVSYLLKHQFKDGSWGNSNALHVPYSEDLVVPADSYFPVANFGTNVRAKEFNRLITTSSILNFLSIYERKKYNNSDSF